MKYGEMPRCHEEVIFNKLVAAAGGDESILAKIVQGAVEITLRVVSFLTATSKQVVNYDRSIADSLKAGKYGWKNDGITDANFPSTETGEREVEFGMFYFNKNTESDANIAQMKSEGFRPATMKETLAYGEKNPEEQRKYPMIGLGSVALLSGYRLVAYLYGDGSWRDARLNFCVNEWNGRCRFLGVRICPLSIDPGV
ncbi:MAG: hypothetical protein NTU76_02815 [Candidatus Taylorbacteria bacterium]|nr:hypothetical protein [Candidatus Taylorbacteria bacterium]